MIKFHPFPSPQQPHIIFHDPFKKGFIAHFLIFNSIMITIGSFSNVHYNLFANSVFFVWKAWIGTNWFCKMYFDKNIIGNIYFDYLIHNIILIKNILQFNLFMKSQAGHWQIDLVKCISSKLKANWSWKCILLSNYESWDQAMTNWSCQMYCMEMEIFSNILNGFR